MLFSDDIHRKIMTLCSEFELTEHREWWVENSKKRNTHIIFTSPRYFSTFDTIYACCSICGCGGHWIGLNKVENGVVVGKTLSVKVGRCEMDGIGRDYKFGGSFFCYTMGFAVAFDRSSWNSPVRFSAKMVNRT